MNFKKIEDNSKKIVYFIAIFLFISFTLIEGNKLTNFVYLGTIYSALFASIIFVFNVIKGDSRSKFSKSIFTALEISANLLAVIFIIFTLIAMFNSYFKINILGDNWQEKLFIILPFIVIPVGLGPLAIGFIMGLIKSSKK